MPKLPRHFCSIGVLLLELCAGVELQAQNALLVQHHDGLARVKFVERGNPLVDDGRGGLTRSSGNGVILQSVPEYLPYFVTVNEGATTRPVGNETEYDELIYFCHVESAYPLKNVFLVLDLTMEGVPHTYLLAGVGDLEPYQPYTVHLDRNLPVGRVAAGKFYTHVFTNGAEVFNSTQTWDYIDQCMDEMTARRIAKVTDARAKPFIGPFPKITPNLQGKSGRVLVHCTVTPAGRLAAWHFTLIRDRQRAGCFKAFRLNHWLGFTLFAGVVAGYAVI